MILKTLKLSNFRQFYGDGDIQFSTGTNRNVTLIHGENGVGKTTILNAILWCLFERLTPDFEQPKDLINSEAVIEGKKSCKVEVYFEHDKKDYVALRIYSKERQNMSFRVHLIELGNYRQVPNPRSFVNSVLPRDMAPYFFFHGEGVASLSEGQAGSRFRSAVRNILGFTFAEQAIEDLTTLKKEYLVKARQSLAKTTELREEERSIRRIEEEKERFEAKLDETRMTLKESSEKLRQIEVQLAESGNVDVERIKRDIGEAERRKKAIERELGQVQKRWQELIAKFGWSIFGAELLEKGLDFIDDSTLKGRIPAPYQDQFVEDLLDTSTCICGRSLPPDSDEEARVKALLETANSALLNQRVMKARSVAANITGRTNEFLEEYASVEARRSSLETAIGEEESKLKEHETHLADIGENRIKNLTAQRLEYKGRERSLLQGQGSLKEKIGRRAQLQQRAERKLASKSSHDAAYIRLKKILGSVEEMIARCTRRLEKYENDARLFIADSVNKFLEEFSRKDYRAKVTESFEFHLARTDNKLVAKSKGEKLLLNLAFVSALIEHAGAREKASGSFLVHGAVAPFVIDAPFGELDDTYRKATAEFLPSKVGQIVLLLSSSHWTGTVDQAIRNRVGSEYVLISNRRNDRGQKPVDNILIGNEAIEQSRYMQARDFTEIQMVS